MNTAEGVWFSLQSMPQLTKKTFKRNRRATAIVEIILHQNQGSFLENRFEYEEDLRECGPEILDEHKNEMKSLTSYGDLSMTVHPGCSGCVIDHFEDFNLKKINVALLKSQILELDEVYIVFSMYVVAKVPKSSINIYIDSLYENTSTTAPS